MAAHRLWADVYVADPTERPVLEDRALFFLPEAPQLCLESGLNQSSLSLEYANRQGSGSLRPLAGRSIIAKVLSGAPVRYESAIGFINLTQRLLTERNRRPLTVENIVACVFRLKDPDIVAEALNTNAEGIAEGCGIRRPIVESALHRYRIQLADALKIWAFLANRLQNTPSVDGGQASREIQVARERLTADPRDFIKTDRRTPMAVRPVDEDAFVYQLGDLRPAPPTGHPWAIFVEAAVGTANQEGAPVGPTSADPGIADQA